jgi:hypothetical protein
VETVVTMTRFSKYKFQYVLTCSLVKFSHTVMSVSFVNVGSPSSHKAISAMAMVNIVTVGVCDGIVEGKFVGCMDGCCVGNSVGFHDGWLVDGTDEGYMDGEMEGNRDGEWDGTFDTDGRRLREGTVVGCTENVGDMVGTVEGEGLGAMVSDGAPVGVPDGTVVGDVVVVGEYVLLGATEGTDVGKRDGVIVGCWVGYSVTVGLPVLGTCVGVADTVGRGECVGDCVGDCEMDGTAVTVGTPDRTTVGDTEGVMLLVGTRDIVGDIEGLVDWVGCTELVGWNDMPSEIAIIRALVGRGNWFTCTIRCIVD